MITRFNRALGDAVSFLYVAVFVLTFGEVFARYVFNSPTQWTLEIALILAGLHYFLCGPQVSAYEGHIAVTVVTERLPDGVQKALRQFGRLVALACCLVLVWAAWNQVSFSIDVHERSGTILNSPMPIILKAALLVALCLMALQTAANILDNSRS
jgi:TRAP-type C4-dicarboxylate transport system permease small subunit